MRDFLKYPPLLGLVFAFNLAIAVTAGFRFDGAQQIVTCVGTGLVSLVAAVALAQQFRNRRPELSAPVAVTA